MRIGFTGTRNGMAPSQRKAFQLHILKLPEFSEFHHGDCVGADDEAAVYVYDTRRAEVVCHPPTDATHRAFGAYHERREEKGHFARNRDIVNDTDMLIATPWQTERPAPKTGGGTWYTIEYAEKQGKPVTIIWPDGRVERT